MCPESGRAGRRFYDEALSQAERSDFPVALDVDGVDDEIALLRLRLRTALEEHPEDLPLMFRGIDLLTRALATRFLLSKDDRTAVGASIAELREEVIALIESAAVAQGRPS